MRIAVLCIFVTTQMLVVPLAHSSTEDEVEKQCGWGGSTAHVVPNEFILNVEPSASDSHESIKRELNSALDSESTPEVRSYPESGIILLRYPDVAGPRDRSLGTAVETLSKKINVKHVQSNLWWRTANDANGTDLSREKDWALHHINAEVARARAAQFGNGGETVVAVVDSGVDLAHDDLRDTDEQPPILWTGADGGHGGSYVTDSKLPGTEILDTYGHGTLVAGIIAGRGKSGRPIGIATNTRIMVVRVLDANRTSTSARVALGIRYAVASGANVVNLSLSTGCDKDFAVREAIKYAHDAGAIVVAAAGNDGAGGLNLDKHPIFPAAIGDGLLVAVGATDEKDRKRRTSRYGMRTVDLGAPGVQITGPWRINDTHTANGTSFAAPLVTGGLALLSQLSEGWSWEQRARYLTATARLPTGSDLSNHFASAGVLDLERSTRAPLEITSPSSTDVWRADGSAVISWNPWPKVGPCGIVDAWYSSNGGIDFDVKLVSDVNDIRVSAGAVRIRIPNHSSEKGMVRLNCRATHLYAFSATFRVE